MFQDIQCTNLFSKYKIVFWDFDGVIKDSVSVKSSAYVSLFPNASKETCSRIEEHHLKHGGISRFVKIPLYMEWSGIEINETTKAKYFDLFEKIVVQKVIDSDFIPGVEEILKKKRIKDIYIILTGTPQREIEDILKTIGYDSYFDKVYGAPIEKASAISQSLLEYKISPHDTILIGDSETDYQASQSSGVNFILVSSGSSAFTKNFTGKRIYNFKEFI